MHNLNKLIFENYNADEQHFLRTKLTGFKILLTEALAESLVFLPLWLTNKDKSGITISETTRNQLTGENAKNNTILDILLFGDLIKETTHNIRVCTVKRGNTILYEKVLTLGFKEIKPLSLYLQNSATHKIRVYYRDVITINNCTKPAQYLIITNLNNNDFANKLISAIPLLFKDSYTWEEQTIEYFRLFADTTEDSNKKRTDYWQKVLTNSKILENLKREKLQNALKVASSYQYTNLTKEIDSVESQIRRMEEELLERYHYLNEKQAQANFWQPKTNTEEAAEYIEKNPYIVDCFGAANAYLVLAVEAPTEYIDIPAFKRMLANPAAFIYPKLSDNFPRHIINHKEKFIEILHDVFLGDRYQIYSRAEVVLDFESNKAYPLRKARDYISSSSQHNIMLEYPQNWELRNRVQTNKCITPHLHIEFYDCWSANKTNITKCLRNSDIIGAIDIIVSTVKDINVNDQAVFKRFLHEGLYSPVPYGQNYAYQTDSGNTFRTIYDKERKEFRTFNDIFYNEYVKTEIQQIDIEEDFACLMS